MREDFWTIRAMIDHGGNFVSALGRAAKYADSDNLEKIKRAWPLCWEHYRVTGRAMMEQDKNKEQQNV
jgi:hypothetical protein